MQTRAEILDELRRDPVLTNRKARRAAKIRARLVDILDWEYEKRELVRESLAAHKAMAEAHDGVSASD